MSDGNIIKYFLKILNLKTSSKWKKKQLTVIFKVYIKLVDVINFFHGHLPVFFTFFFIYLQQISNILYKFHDDN